MDKKIFLMDQTQSKLLEWAERLIWATVQDCREDYTSRRESGEGHDEIVQDIYTDLTNSCDECLGFGRIMVNHIDTFWDIICERLELEYQQPERKHILTQCF